MNISSEQAAAALRDIEDTQIYSRTLRAYQIGSSHLLMWGVIWVVGYTVTGLTPYAGLAWPLLIIVGVAGGIFVRRAQVADLSATAQERWRLMLRRNALSWLVLMVFWAGVYAVMQPHTSNQYCAFPAILMGAIYAAVGVWAALPRYFWLGIGVSALTLAGYFLLAPWFALWMAAVGGGGLILGGLWMRKV